MQAYCGWKQREDLLLSFRRSIGALRGDERRSPGAVQEARAYNTIVAAGYAALIVARQASVYDATQGLQHAWCDDVSRTVVPTTVADQAADRIHAFTTHALDALGHPDPKPVPAHPEEFANAR
jgi:hypothetical protein